jgi:hypothetical protein
MNRKNAIRIAAALSESANVLDVGGGGAPFPRATHVLDAISFDDRGRCCANLLEDVIPARFTRDTWRQADVCDRKPWPYANKSFDYVTCSHLLEDIRDPIWVCSELQRVAKAGYIEVPSRILEQCLGVENPTYAGYYHHRWLVTISGSRVVFQHKPHNLHTLKSAIVARIGATERINPRYESDSLEWRDSFDYVEELVFDESDMERSLSEFAARSRRLPALVVNGEDTLAGKMRRSLYYARLRRGGR